MSQPKGFRRRENLTPEERTNHDAMAARVIWRPMLSFDRAATDDPNDHGDQPYEPGDSLIDRERRGEFRVRHSTEWIGGLRIFVDDGDTHQAEVMLDRQQVYLLTTGLLRWLAGTLASWLRKPFGAQFMCRDCGGTGFTVREG